MLPVSTNYLLVMAAWWLALGGALWGLLVLRRGAKPRTAAATVANAGLSAWLLLSALTAAEFAAALFADFSDAFNTTTISQRWFDRHIEAQKNEAGLRDGHAFRAKLPPGVERVAFFGDSFTIGHGIEALADRFSDRVAARLENESPGRYVVDNFGTPGFGISQIDARIRSLLAAGIRLDWAVYVFTLNDIEDYHPDTLSIIRSIRREQPRGFVAGHTYLLNWLYVRFLQARGTGTGDYFGELERAYAAEGGGGEAWRRLEGDLRALWRDARSARSRPVFVIFPFVHELGSDYRFEAAHEKLAALAGEAGVPVLDLSPTLRNEAREASLVVNRFDPHPNERAHEIAAQEIGDLLVRELRARRERGSR